MADSISGSRIVDEISQMGISSIPETWYRNIRRGNSPHGLAILVLWDLLYWYKWSEIRDEGTGLVVGYRRKFRADLLQRSYTAIAEKFGVSKRQATEIIIFLEKLGVLRRVFRTLKTQDLTVGNVLFIELVPSRIREISFPKPGDFTELPQDGEGDSTEICKGYHTEDVSLSQNRAGGCPINMGEGGTQKRETNTISSQTISQSNSQECSHSVPEFVVVCAPEKTRSEKNGNAEPEKQQPAFQQETTTTSGKQTQTLGDKNHTQRFLKPTVGEIQAYCKERGNSIDAQYFFDYYESKGWLVGRTPMKNWQAAVRTWERNESSRPSGVQTKKSYGSACSRYGVDDFKPGEAAKYIRF